MRSQRVHPTHHKQRGQTLVLVAISLVSLLAMGALAVDLATLYSARSEMQRAADAAALAGAQAFVASGTTTDPTDANLQTLATNLANGYINALLANNTVGGATPALKSAPTFDFTTHPGNPTITVTLQRTDLPTFFSRIFGRKFASVSATAVAEAYNSSNTTGASGTMPAVAPTCVKPWLVVNIDPNNHGSGTNKPFVNADGSLASPATAGVWTGTAGGVVGEPLTLGNLWTNTLPTILTNPGYLPAALTAAPSGTCPSCSVGGGNFAESVACCDTANANQYSCGSTTSILSVDVVSDVTATLAGASCLLTGAATNAPILGNDTLNPANFQSTSGGSPMEITSGTSPHSGQLVTTSGQIVTLPIINTTLLGLQAQTIGYMQAFVQQTLTGGGVSLTVLNISGCGTNIGTGLTPVSGGGVSPVPIRLINPN